MNDIMQTLSFFIFIFILLKVRQRENTFVEISPSMLHNVIRFYNPLLVWLPHKIIQKGISSFPFHVVELVQLVSVVILKKFLG